MLELRNINKDYNGQRLLTDISFSVERDETVCILGPSGVGKSTLLRIITGLEQAEAGQILWDGQDISSLAPYKRGFGLMFQDYALFPHLNVFENIAFGLKMQHIPHDSLQKRVLDSLEMVGLEHIADRSVSDLSGGEKQRVAFARALAPKPKLLMLDEPMGSLDRALRDQLTRELHILLGETDIPVIYVTHDQQEAFSIGDRLLIFNQGGIVQSGSPREIYSHPSSLWVASFFGLTNRLAGEVISTQPARVKTGLGEIAITCADGAFNRQEKVDLVILPTAAKITNGSGSTSSITGNVADSFFMGIGYSTQVAFEGEGEMTFELPEKLTKGSQVTLAIDPNAVLCFHREN